MWPLSPSSRRTLLVFQRSHKKQFGNKKRGKLFRATETKLLMHITLNVFKKKKKLGIIFLPFRLAEHLKIIYFVGEVVIGRCRRSGDVRAARRPRSFSIRLSYRQKCAWLLRGMASIFYPHFFLSLKSEIIGSHFLFAHLQSYGRSPRPP